MGGGRAAAAQALLSRSFFIYPGLLCHHPSAFRPLLSLRPLHGGAAAPVRMASSDGALQKDGAAAPPSSSSAIDFLTLCHRLKTTKRAGWVRRGVRDPESVADHMYRMGVMALISTDLPGVDRERCIKMAIVHDIAEAIVGDITPSDGVPKLEKSRLEQEALDHMCRLLGGGSRAKEIYELWAEYEENSSLEAKLVKDFDKNKKKTWMNSFSQLQGSFRRMLAKPGHQRLSLGERGEQSRRYVLCGS